MTDSPRWNESPQPDELPPHQALLAGTDWASTATVSGNGENLPAALERLLDPDPVVRTAAADEAFRAVTDQNTLYEAAASVASYVAAVLHHPAITVGEAVPGTDRPTHRPTLVRLLEWLGDTARDADDERVAIGERQRGAGFLDGYREMRAFRDLRPVLFSAVRPLLGHENPEVRDTALVAALPLAEHPDLAAHRRDLVEHACRLLATSPDNHYRALVLDAMRAWGQDVSSLENADDVAARELRARHLAEHCSAWPGDGTVGMDGTAWPSAGRARIQQASEPGAGPGLPVSHRP
ncbi:hypothetical protein ACIPW5_09805 [Streptomyces sp. NPDC090077]|uniref:hypothetical protein n=1 Tax=Streptomyces sp. NPDC090077 TaxID=3365938 RepID=UPI003800EA00